MNKPTRAASEFFNFAICLPTDMLVAFLVSHGYAAVWSYDSIKAVAVKIGAVEAHAQLEAIRKAAVEKRDAERAVKLAAARTAWVNGDPRAFDGINW